MLALLFLFLVPYRVPHGFGWGRAVDLAPVRNPRSLPEADREDAVIITVARDGAIFFNREKIPLDLLRSRISDALPERPRQTVFFNCDMRARWGLVRDAMEEARLAGTFRFAFLTEKSR